MPDNTQNEARDFHGRWTAGAIGEAISKVANYDVTFKSIAGWFHHSAKIDVTAPTKTDPAKITWADLTKTAPAKPVTPATAKTAKTAKPRVSSKDKKQMAAVADKATATARQLGYDPSRIIVRKTLQTLAVGGRNLKVDGLSHGATSMSGGYIEISAKISDENIAGVVAHEIEHQKVNEFIRDNPKDYRHLVGNGEALAKTDGVTNYSRSYWSNSAFIAGGKKFYTLEGTTAIDETLAEIALVHQSKPDQFPWQEREQPLSKEWSALYSAVNEHWDKKHPGKRGAP
jgi:hypothetical protein